SNPPSEYIWFYNNSKIFSGQQYIISKVSRTQTGIYTCFAQNLLLKTSTKNSIILTVYYLPDGKVTCTVLAANNYKDIILSCLWEGGFPKAELRWVRSHEEENDIVSYSNVTKRKIGLDTPNNSSYSCLASHPVLKSDAICKTTVYSPYGNPRCFAMATKNHEFIMLSCNWEGGLPFVHLWWKDWENNLMANPKESVNMHVLNSNTNYSGKEFTCEANHPLLSSAKKCRFKLEAPALAAQRNTISVYEGSDVQLTCVLKKTYPTSEIIWYNN
uniref:Ig-like domain-containing protein n=1 Tax=Latimeria chalumnae TaxID=7897 RepID=H3BDN4_LATCH